MDEQVFQNRIPLLLRGPSVMGACRCPMVRMVRAPNFRPPLPAPHSSPDDPGKKAGNELSWIPAWRRHGPQPSGFAGQWDFEANSWVTPEGGVLWARCLTRACFWAETCLRESSDQGGFYLCTLPWNFPPPGW